MDGRMPLCLLGLMFGGASHSEESGGSLSAYLSPRACLARRTNPHDTHAQEYLHHIKHRSLSNRPPLLCFLRNRRRQQQGGGYAVVRREEQEEPEEEGEWDWNGEGEEGERSVEIRRVGGGEAV